MRGNLTLALHIREATDSFENYELLTTMFTHLIYTGSFALINGIRTWVEFRSLVEEWDLPVAVPCHSAEDIESFIDFLSLRYGAEDARGAFVYACRNLDGVLGHLYRSGSERPVQSVAWDGFPDAYEAGIPMVQDTQGRLYELWSCVG